MQHCSIAIISLLLSIMLNSVYGFSTARAGSILTRSTLIRSLSSQSSISSQPTELLPKWRVKTLLVDGAQVVGKRVNVEGWVKTLRDQKKNSFIEISDGSSLKGIQAVADATIPTYDQVIFLM